MREGEKEMKVSSTQLLYYQSVCVCVYEIVFIWCSKSTVCAYLQGHCELLGSSCCVCVSL